jgi:hypothetical protein
MFFFHLQIIGHGNPDNNLESPCIGQYYTLFISCLLRDAINIETL